MATCTAVKDPRQLTTTPPASRAAEPKSTSLMWPVAEMSMFSGFTSLREREERRHTSAAQKAPNRHTCG